MVWTILDIPQATKYLMLECLSHHSSINDLQCNYFECIAIASFIECFKRFCNQPLCSINSNPSTCWMFNYTCLFCTNTTKCSLIHHFKMGYILFKWTQQFLSSIDRPHFCITNVHVITTIFSSSIRTSIGLIYLCFWFPI